VFVVDQNKMISDLGIASVVDGPVHCNIWYRHELACRNGSISMTTAMTFEPCNQLTLLHFFQSAK